MVPRLLLVALLLALPLWIVTVPSDPLWIPGAYDGGDYDDTVSPVDSPSAFVTPPARVAVAPLVMTPDRIRLFGRATPSYPTRLASASRSPPQS